LPETWTPQAIFVSDWLIYKKSSPLKPGLPNESKLDMKHPWKVIYKFCAFSSHLLINMTAAITLQKNVFLIKIA
jgi:hypothetical protein